MRKFIVLSAALALSLGATAAMAQIYQSTTVQTSPDVTTRTTTTTTRNDNGYVQYRTTTKSIRRYDASPLEVPADYNYTRYTVGQYVPQAFLEDADLTVDDYADYRLIAPPQGLEWIRVGNDALLVDRADGEVIRADYNLFD